MTKLLGVFMFASVFCIGNASAQNGSGGSGSVSIVKQDAASKNVHVRKSKTAEKPATAVEKANHSAVGLTATKTNVTVRKRSNHLFINKHKKYAPCEAYFSTNSFLQFRKLLC